MWIQKTIVLNSYPRGFHLITDLVLKKVEEIHSISMGVFHLFIKHTSASLTINEDSDLTVRSDFESHFNQMVPENQPYYQHTFEGSDDIPAHLKSSILGSSISIPISNGILALGTWQGIYFCEHRSHSKSRTLIATVQGE